MSEHSISPKSATEAQPQKKRIRAIVACSHCRSKRSKCDGVPGQQACSQCQQRGIECEMSSGKRNRGHYKPQVEALTKRVRILEEALVEAQAINQQLLTQMQQQQQQDTHEQTPQTQQNQLPGSPFAPLMATAWDPHGHHMHIDDVPALCMMPDGHDVETTAPSSMPPPLRAFSSVQYHADNARRLSSPAKQLALGQGEVADDSKRGSSTTTTARSLHSDAATRTDYSPAKRRACCTDLDLSPPLVDYLLGLFFHRYQLMMKFVSQQDFMQQQTPDEAVDGEGAFGDGGSSSSRYKTHHSCCYKRHCALFLAMLAAALRYSTRPNVTERFTRPNGENKLAIAARRAVETEVSQPTLETVQTLLILCEVETSLDNQMTGYMYSCLASKLIFEMGLDLGSNTSSKALTAEETTIRHWLVWAASVHDQFWAVFLRRPLAIKNQTLQLSRLAWRFAGRMALNELGDVMPSPTFEDEVNDDLMDLMELAREITDELYGASSPLQRPTAAAQAAAAAAASAKAAVQHAHASAGLNSGCEDMGTDGGDDEYDGGRSYDGGGLPYILHAHAAQHQAQSQLPDVAKLDARLNQWFNSLSDKVRRGPVSGQDCYHFLFVLHMHFNATKIILHRTRAFPAQAVATRSGRSGTWAYSGPPPSSYPLNSPVAVPSGSVKVEAAAGGTGGMGDSAAAASMATLGEASICIAKLFETFRRREDIRTLQCTGVQWAAMASEALTWYIETLPIDGAIEAVAHLQSLSRTIKDMMKTFLPAVYAYDRTNAALRMFTRRMDGGDSPPLPATQVLRAQAQSEPSQAQGAVTSFPNAFYMKSALAYDHPDDGETVSSLPSFPGLAASTTATTFSASLAATTSTFGAEAAPAPEGVGSSVSVSAIAQSAAKYPGHTNTNACCDNGAETESMYATTPDQGFPLGLPYIGAVDLGSWTDNGPWDWGDLMDR